MSSNTLLQLTLVLQDDILFSSNVFSVISIDIHKRRGNARKCYAQTTVSLGNCVNPTIILLCFLQHILTLILCHLNCRNDETRQPLSRKVPLPSSRINPYRMVIVIRLIVLSIFLHYRITNPVRNAYPLWLLSVICEIWFAISWILDQFPKWFPINRETYLDRLALR